MDWPSSQSRKRDASEDESNDLMAFLLPFPNVESKAPTQPAQTTDGPVVKRQRLNIWRRSPTSPIIPGSSLFSFPSASRSYSEVGRREYRTTERPHTVAYRQRKEPSPYSSHWSRARPWASSSPGQTERIKDRRLFRDPVFPERKRRLAWTADTPHVPSNSSSGLTGLSQTPFKFSLFSPFEPRLEKGEDAVSHRRAFNLRPRPSAAAARVGGTASAVVEAGDIQDELPGKGTPEKKGRQNEVEAASDRAADVEKVAALERELAEVKVLASRIPDLEQRANETAKKGEEMEERAVKAEDRMTKMGEELASIKMELAKITEHSPSGSGPTDDATHRLIVAAVQEALGRTMPALTGPSAELNRTLSDLREDISKLKPMHRQTFT